jgi:hypothetical protein
MAHTIFHGIELLPETMPVKQLFVAWRGCELRRSIVTGHPIV